MVNYSRATTLSVKQNRYSHSLDDIDVIKLGLERSFLLPSSYGSGFVYQAMHNPNSIRQSQLLMPVSFADNGQTFMVALNPADKYNAKALVKAVINYQNLNNTGHRPIAINLSGYNNPDLSDLKMHDLVITTKNSSLVNLERATLNTVTLYSGAIKASHATIKNTVLAGYDVSGSLFYGATVKNLRIDGISRNLQARGAYFTNVHALDVGGSNFVGSHINGIITAYADGTQFGSGGGKVTRSAVGAQVPQNFTLDATYATLWDIKSEGMVYARGATFNALVAKNPHVDTGLTPPVGQNNIVKFSRKDAQELKNNIVKISRKSTPNYPNMTSVSEKRRKELQEYYAPRFG